MTMTLQCNHESVKILLTAAVQYGATAPGPMRKDAWDVRVRCLEVLSKAAYPVSIEVGSAMYPDLK